MELSPQQPWSGAPVAAVISPVTAVIAAILTAVAAVIAPVLAAVMTPHWVK